MPLIEVFGRLGLRHVGSTAIDVDRLLTALGARDGAVLARALAEAVSGVLDAAVAFTDPAFAVIGGPWGSAAPFAAELAAALTARPRGIRIAQPRVDDDPSLAGARAAAVHSLRDDLVARSRKGNQAAAGERVKHSSPAG